MNSELKNIKREIILNFNINDLYTPPSNQEIIEKWEEIIKNLIFILKNEIIDINNNNDEEKKCFQEIYQEINDLLLFEIPKNIIDKINNIIEDFSNKINEKFKIINKSENFFEDFNFLWKKIINNFNLLRKIMNRYEKKAYGNIQKNNVYVIFLDYLKKKILNDKETNFLQTLINNIISKISDLRNLIISKSLKLTEENVKNNLENLKLSIDFLFEAGLYKENFNVEFIEQTTKFYSYTTKNIIEKIELENYVEYVDLVFKLENEIILHNLNEISLKPVINNLNNILIKEKINIIFDKFYDNKNKENLFNEKFELLEKIFKLLKSIKIEEKIKKKFDDYIKNSFNNIYKNYNKNFLDFYNNLLALKNNIDNFVSKSFMNDDKFKNTGKESLIKSMNNKPFFITNIFSRYIDYILTTEAKNKNFDEIKKLIDEFMILFKLIESKDIFENFFIKKLANRCLDNSNYDEKYQNYLIEELKKECGTFFVSKSQEMLSDVNLSKEMNLDYHNKKSKNKNNDNITFYVFSNYSWPIEKLLPGNINKFIENNNKDFEEYYKIKNAGKSLTWHLPYCSAEIEFEVNNKKYTIKCNGIFAAILNCFKKNNKENTIKTISEITNIKKEEDLLPFVREIVNKKILIKNGNVYIFNDNFNSDENEIHFNNLNKDEISDKENEEVEERTFEDKKPIIEAYIMKTSKAKKIMTRNKIIEGVLNDLPFKADKNEVEKRIDQLINNRYISKDEKDSEILKYC